MMDVIGVAQSLNLGDSDWLSRVTLGGSEWATLDTVDDPHHEERIVDLNALRRRSPRPCAPVTAT